MLETHHAVIRVASKEHLALAMLATIELPREPSAPNYQRPIAIRLSIGFPETRPIGQSQRYRSRNSLTLSHKSETHKESAQPNQLQPGPVQHPIAPRFRSALLKAIFGVLLLRFHSVMRVWCRNCLIVLISSGPAMASRRS